MSERDEPGLWQSLMRDSAEIHRAAERRPFMVVFFKAELPKDAYIEYLGRLSYIYAALEETSEALKDDSVVGRMHTPELHRSAAIDADMRFLAGEDWRDRVKPSPQTESYVAAIRSTIDRFPPAFAPHQWLRYLGNVLAQRINLRIMNKAYGFDEQGTAFFRFDRIEDPRGFLKSYHEKMNSMPLDDDQIKRCVDEVNGAWQHQIDFTDELAADFGLRHVSVEEAEQLMSDLAAHHP
ncbi:MAG TPA: biliverdin-producing heme oxygenase [Actinomycetota bacterium]|nr:biliverdin-producing heme oxygenase [Actinomycetota bacterium]